MKNIVLYGASGFGREVAYIIERINEIEPTYNLLGFIDDDDGFDENTDINGYPWLGKGDWILERKDECCCVCTIGFPHTKAEIQRRLTEQGVRFETIIAPGVRIPPYTSIGKGCVIYSGVGLSVNCTVGDGVLLNARITVGHDASIGDYTTIMTGTGISGFCRIGSEVNIGGHVFIIPGRKIGDNATLAAGSVVFTNVKAGSTVLGNPAKRMKELE